MNRLGKYLREELRQFDSWDQVTISMICAFGLSIIIHALQEAGGPAGSGERAIKKIVWQREERTTELQGPYASGQFHRVIHSFTRFNKGGKVDTGTELYRPT